MRARTLTLISAVVIAAAAGAFWLLHALSQCTFSETAPQYSKEHRFYARIQATVCNDDSKTRLNVVMGESGTSRSVVVLELRSSLDAVHYLWHEGPELHIQVPESSILKHYGPYDNWPRVVVTNP